MLCDTCIYKSDECPHLKAWHSALRIISDFTNSTSEDTLEVISTVAEFSCQYHVEQQQCNADADESISTEDLKKALECCSRGTSDACRECPRYLTPHATSVACTEELLALALERITELEKKGINENEKL